MNSIYAITWRQYQPGRGQLVNSDVQVKKHVDLSKIVAIQEVAFEDDVFPFFTIDVQLMDKPLVFMTAPSWRSELQLEFIKLRDAWMDFKEQQ